MGKYAIRSAFLTMLYLEQYHLQTKDNIDSKHRYARKIQLKREQGEKLWLDQDLHRILSDDLESFYTSQRKPGYLPEEESVAFFLAQKISEEEQTLLKNRNKDYLNKFKWYHSDSSKVFDIDMKKIKKSSDPESIYRWNEGKRLTMNLNVTLLKNLNR